MNPFEAPMQPYPSLARWSRQVQLPQGGVALHYYDTLAGAGTPLLLLHGLGDEADTWRSVLPLLSEGRRVIAPDLPGFGGSDKARRAYTIPFFAETMLAFLDLLGISRVALAGHSMGAVIAQTMALAHPDRVERLALVSGGLLAQETRPDLGLLAFLLPGLGEWSYTRLRKDPQAAYATLRPYYYRLDDLPQAERDFLYQRVNERVWSNGQRRGFLSALRNLVRWLPAQQKGLPERLRASRVPTRVVWGDHDQVSAPGNAQALAQLLPGARLTMAVDAGHNVQQEQPALVAGVIADQD